MRNVFHQIGFFDISKGKIRRNANGQTNMKDQCEVQSPSMTQSIKQKARKICVAHIETTPTEQVRSKMCSEDEWSKKQNEWP